MSTDLQQDRDCQACRRALAECFDGDTVGLCSVTREHLAGCAECRDHAGELQDIRDGLSALPLQILPAARTADILAATVDHPPAPGGGRLCWRRGLIVGLAAAATIVLAVNLPRATVMQRSGPEDARTQLAADQTRLALGLAFGAIEHAEKQALHRVPGVLGRVLARIKDADAAQDTGSGG